MGSREAANNGFQSVLSFCPQRAQTEESRFGETLGQLGKSLYHYALRKYMVLGLDSQERSRRMPGALKESGGVSGGKHSLPSWMVLCDLL